MKWHFQPDRPIYLQLQEQIVLRILSGIYPPGSRLPSVREMAGEASVNPNTLQRALTELERGGLVYANRTSGRYVTEDTNMLQQAKQRIALEQIQSFLNKMKELGYSRQDILSMMQQEKGASEK